MSSRLTREERQKIVRLALNRQSIKEIRKVTGRSREAIVPELTRAGLYMDGVERHCWYLAERKYSEQQRNTEWSKRVRFRDIPYAEQVEWVVPVKEEYLKNCEAYRKLLMDDCRGDDNVPGTSCKDDIAKQQKVSNPGGICISVKSEYPNLPLIEERFKNVIADDLAEAKRKKEEETSGDSVRSWFVPVFRVEVFAQSFPNTLGLKQRPGAISGQALTDYYISVIREMNTDIYGIFQKDELVYTVRNANEAFLRDLRNHKIADIGEAELIYKALD